MKHQHQSEEFRFNEILFEHRNKEYGAYVLRNEAGRVLTKSLFLGVSLLAAISITPVVINAFKTADVIEEIPTSGPFVIQDVYEQPEKPLPQSQPVHNQPVVKTTDETVPEPKAHVTNEKVIEKIEGAVAGIKNNSEGEIAPPNVYVSTTPTIKTGPAIVTDPPKIADPVGDNHVAEIGELGKEAEFIGGIDSFRSKVMNNFDGSGFEGSNDVMKTTITFIVERDGTISGIKADGKNVTFNSEAIRTIKSIRGKWVPGKNKQGQPVRSYFKFPISMKFDN